MRDFVSFAANLLTQYSQFVSVEVPYYIERRMGTVVTDRATDRPLELDPVKMFEKMSKQISALCLTLSSSPLSSKDCVYRACFPRPVCLSVYGTLHLYVVVLVRLSVNLSAN